LDTRVGDIWLSKIVLLFGFAARFCVRFFGDVDVIEKAEG